MEIAQVPIEYLKLSPFRQGKPLPRVNAATLRTIQRHGLITPVIARPISTHRPEQYEILSGEDRWLGAQQAGLHEIPVYIRRDLSTAEAAQIVRLALESEGDRLLEEATAAKDLVAQGLSITEVGDRTGRTRTAVAHLLRLLKLCAPVQQLLTEGQLKYGHARPLVGLSGDQQIRLARRIIQQGLSGRAVGPGVAQRGGRRDRRVDGCTERSHQGSRSHTTRAGPIRAARLSGRDRLPRPRARPAHPPVLRPRGVGGRARTFGL
jgi:ParB family chromosome partitioning protein